MVSQFPSSVQNVDYEPTELYIYPNPTTGILTIEGTTEVYDIYGRLVLTANSNTLDISKAATGIYFVRVLDEGG